MMLNLSQIGQIGRPVSDVDRSEAFYEKVVGLHKLFRFGDLTLALMQEAPKGYTPPTR